MKRLYNETELCEWFDREYERYERENLLKIAAFKIHESRIIFRKKTETLGKTDQLWNLAANIK